MSAKHTPGPWWETEGAVTYAADVTRLKADATELLEALKGMVAWATADERMRVSLEADTAAQAIALDKAQSAILKAERKGV